MKLRTLFVITFAVKLILLTGCTGHTENDAHAKNQAQTKTDTQMNDHRSISFNTITGEPTSLADFAGKVVLIVNTASKCGFTKQYVGLESLYREKKDSGLVVIAFPANNFADQEPGTNEEILRFCRGTFDVTFPIMAKVDVIGDKIHPLFEYLTEKSSLPGKIGWNFNKFLLDREGNLVARYDSKVEPDDRELVEKIDDLL